MCAMSENNIFLSCALHSVPHTHTRTHAQCQKTIFFKAVLYIVYRTHTHTHTHNNNLIGERTNRVFVLVGIGTACNIIYIALLYITPVKVLINLELYMIALPVKGVHSCPLFRGICIFVLKNLHGICLILAFWLYTFIPLKLLLL